MERHEWYEKNLPSYTNEKVIGHIIDRAKEEMREETNDIETELALFNDRIQALEESLSQRDVRNVGSALKQGEGVIYQDEPEEEPCNCGDCNKQSISPLSDIPPDGHDRCEVCRVAYGHHEECPRLLEKVAAEPEPEAAPEVGRVWVFRCIQVQQGRRDYMMLDKSKPNRPEEFIECHLLPHGYIEPVAVSELAQAQERVERLEKDKTELHRQRDVQWDHRKSAEMALGRRVAELDKALAEVARLKEELDVQKANLYAQTMFSKKYEAERDEAIQGLCEQAEAFSGSVGESVELAELQSKYDALLLAASRVRVAWGGGSAWRETQWIRCVHEFCDLLAESDPGVGT